MALDQDFIYILGTAMAIFFLERKTDDLFL